MRPLVLLTPLATPSTTIWPSWECHRRRRRDARCGVLARGIETYGTAIPKPSATRGAWDADGGHRTQARRPVEAGARVGRGRR